MASDVRIKLLLACADCGQRNYATTKNRRNTSSKLELKKFCPTCGGYKVHKETKI
ncbi:MAG: 50S ribosomal protein L33 [Deinococcus sp.]|nr:50S ribosomal protein L33 [Deinococcus sp.]